MYKSLEDWNNEWTSSFDHYQQDTRHAYYVNAIIGDLNNILEIAAGSFRELLQEQIRVTKKMIIASVHNRHCQQFFDYFERKKETAPLFDIRFFSKDEMIALFSPHCKEVEVIPIGKQKKFSKTT